jgi:hypothetical protein
VITHIGRFPILVRRGTSPTEALFLTGARGRHERGIYRFWTAVLEHPHETIIARARRALPPGERFQRFFLDAWGLRDLDPVSADANECVWRDVLGYGRAVRYIRPSTAREVWRWVTGHRADATPVYVLVQG